MEKDCYEILGVSRDAKPDEIKAAFRALALRRHPDLNGGDPKAAERFMRVQEAYEVLGNPYRRARYDLARAWRARDAAPAAPAARPAPPRGSGVRLLMLLGALIALRGFAGIFFGPQDAFIPSWLLAPDGRENSFRLYVTGTALVFCAAGLRRLRRD